VIGLMAAGDMKEPCVERAIEFLLTRQNADGSWDEDEPTGTGFPRVFYLKYHLYRNSFPVYALGRYRNMLEGRSEYHSVELDAADFRNRSN
jgi:squalene-hopene/tetraprenyl-beta-curcumene cyclase